MAPFEPSHYLSQPGGPGLPAIDFRHTCLVLPCLVLPCMLGTANASVPPSFPKPSGSRESGPRSGQYVASPRCTKGTVTLGKLVRRITMVQPRKKAAAHRHRHRVEIQVTLVGAGEKKKSNGRMLGGSGGKHNVLPVSVCSDLQGGGIVGLALAPAPVSACVAILFQNWMPMEHAGESGGSSPSQRRQQPPDLRPPHVLEGEGGGGRWPISTCPGQAGRPRRFGWLGQAPVRTRRASCHGNVSGGWAPSAIGVQAAPVVKRVATGWGSRGR